MRYFVPDLISPSQSAGAGEFAERFGGLPLGLPAELWPSCSDCNRPMSLLAQLQHHADRLDLGRDGRVLFVFQCNWDPGMCETWSASSGANACFVTEPEQLAGTQTQNPMAGLPLDPLVEVAGWLESDDRIDADLQQSFYSEQAHSALDDEVWNAVFPYTKLGSVPAWIQSPDEAPKDGWQFVGQLDTSYAFFDVGAGIDSGPTETQWGPNFGDLGRGYIFLRPSDDGTPPQGQFFWQCS